MRRACFAAIRMEDNRHFGDARTLETGLDDHLGGKFHAGATLIQPLVEFFGKTPQAAIDIVDRRAKPPSDQHREHGIAPPSVQQGHRARHYPPPARGQTAALH